MLENHQKFHFFDQCERSELIHYFWRENWYHYQICNVILKNTSLALNETFSDFPTLCYFCCDLLILILYLYYNLIFILLQYWMLSKTGEIRRDEACLDYAGSDVILYPCHGSKGNQFWTYDHEVWQSS